MNGFKNNLTLAIFVLLSFFSPTHPCGAEDGKLDEQVDLVIRCQQTNRKATDPWPELRPYFVQNVEAVKQTVATNSEILQNVQKYEAIALGLFDQNTMDMVRYMAIHRLFAMFLSQFLSQKHSLAREIKKEAGGKEKWAQDPQLTEQMNCIITHKMSPPNLKQKQLRLEEGAAHGFYWIPFVCPNGLASIPTIVKAMAHRIVIAGCPLTLTSFDGRAKLCFPDHLLYHDLFDHVRSSETSESNNFWSCTKHIFDAIQTVYEIVQRTPSHKDSKVDTYCQFLIFHEDFFEYLDHTQEKSFDTITLGHPLDRSIFVSACKATCLIFVQKINIFNNPRFAEYTSIIKACEAKFRPISIIESIPKSSGREKRWQVEYNILLIIKSELNAAGVDFDVWIGDQFNAEGMIRILTQIFDDFCNRYQSQLPLPPPNPGS